MIIEGNPSISVKVEKPFAVAVNSCLSFVGGIFNTNNSCYDQEKKLVDQLTSESLDMAGEFCDWYKIDYSLYNERIFGEDNDRRVRKIFKVKLYFELPSDDRAYNRFGIEGLDVFQVRVGFLAWNAYTKRADEEGYKPQIGDVFRPHYSGIFYEIIDVKDSDAQILNTQHSWLMTAKVWENPMLREYKDGTGEEITQTTDRENAIVEDPPPALKPMKHYLKDGSDTLKQNGKLDKSVLYNNGKDNDPFGLNW